MIQFVRYVDENMDNTWIMKDGPKGIKEFFSAVMQDGTARHPFFRDELCEERS